eukprot:5587279-Pyramimonas_sp.AAC.1
MRTWKGSPSPLEQPSWLEELPSMEIPEAEDPDAIASASKAFKKNTCQPDRVHPRHFALLCRPARAVLAKIFVLVDALGVHP